MSTCTMTNFRARRGADDHFTWKSRPTGEVTEIEVYYTKGGANYFSGGTTPRGVYVSCGTVTINDGVKSFVMFSSKAFLAATCKMKQPKLVSRVVDAFDPHCEEIASLYESGRKQEAFEVIKSVIEKLQASSA